MSTILALCTPELRPGAVKFNANNIISCINKHKKADLIVFPRLCITGATCGSMYSHPLVTDASKAALEQIAAATDKTVIAGLPIVNGGKVYDATAVIRQGKYELYRMPQGMSDIGSTSLLFGSDDIPLIDIDDFKIKILPSIPSESGEADLIVVPSAYPSYVGGKAEKISLMKCLPAAALVSSGQGESVSGRVMSGDKILCIGGKLEAYGDYSEEAVTAKVSRIKVSHRDTVKREISLTPLSDDECAEAYEIMGRGILGRMREIGNDKVILGLSGGLDSANVLVAATLAFDKYKLDKKNIICVTMRGGASSRRTQDNAAALIEAYKTTCINVPIDSAVTLHMRAISHDSRDVVFENAQARERTQILLDLSNKYHALMLGTGDLSEICLGWSTFGGDQLSQYNPNCSLTKTAVRRMLGYYTTQKFNKAAAKIIEDILATPVSPELLTGQETESILGPYEVHDLFIREIVALRRSPSEAIKAATDKLGIEMSEAKKYMHTFLNRFFRYQFKRNFGPDGVKLFPYDLFDETIRSDFDPELWLADLEK